MTSSSRKPDERRRRVLVVSDTRFHQATARAIVAPAIATVAADESPWRPGVDERFAIDFLTTLSVNRLLARGPGRRGMLR